MLTAPHNLADTIVACATPPGEGAIAIVRLSGGLCRAVLTGLLGRSTPTRPHRLRRARVVDGGGAPLDDAMVVEMPAPHSYTGEDVVELHLHGSQAVVQTVMERAKQLGARAAQPGEFTLRAFLNGRLSLDQAEAVADLIASYNQSQAVASARLLGGELKSRVDGWLDGAEGVLATLRAALDFPDQTADESLLGDDELEGTLLRLTSLGGELGHVIQEARVDLRGPRSVVLCGAPNAGKSTLLNALAGRRRVLVDGAPGTTRDPVEIEVEDGQGRWRLVDTAGLREGALGLEAAGIALSRESIARADSVVWLVDCAAPRWPPQGLAVDLWVASRRDLASADQLASLAAEAKERRQTIDLWLSITGDGAELWLAAAAPRRLDHGAPLRGELGALLAPRPIGGALVVTRQRHLDLLRLAAAAIDRVGELTGGGQRPLDLVTMEVEAAARALGAIVGRDVDAEVLDQIFASFCIGK